VVPPASSRTSTSGLISQAGPVRGGTGRKIDDEVLADAGQHPGAIAARRHGE
jgi:hypothetical protein